MHYIKKSNFFLPSSLTPCSRALLRQPVVPQKISQILFKPKFDCHHHNNTPLIDILSQFNLDYNRPTYLKCILSIPSILHISFTICPSLQVSDQNPLLPFLFCYASHMLHPSHFPLSDHPDNVLRGSQITQFPPAFSDFPFQVHRSFSASCCRTSSVHVL